MSALRSVLSTPQKYCAEGKDLITLASMFRMPVSLHNIEDKDIYRPHAWSAFGTKELESADYRACAEYGELYK